MEFRELTLYDVEQIRKWRNKCLESLRTPFLLTEEMQEQFYNDVVCNRNAKSRYWGIWTEEYYLMGMCGLENIEWENSIAEISIILRPDIQGKGFGMQAVDMLIRKGFDQLCLKTIYGECYECNSALGFWKKVIEKHDAYSTRLPDRKFYNGCYYDSLYFSIAR